MLKLLLHEKVSTQCISLFQHKTTIKQPPIIKEYIFSLLNLPDLKKYFNNVYVALQVHYVYIIQMNEIKLNIWGGNYKGCSQEKILKNKMKIKQINIQVCLSCHYHIVL